MMLHDKITVCPVGYRFFVLDEYLNQSSNQKGLQHRCNYSKYRDIITGQINVLSLIRTKLK